MAFAGDIEDAVQFVGWHSVVFDERYFEAVDVYGHGFSLLCGVAGYE